MTAPAVIAFDTEQDRARWSHDHAARLMAKFTRDELIEAWTAAGIGGKTEAVRAGKRFVAVMVAIHDGNMLGRAIRTGVFGMEADRAAALVRAEATGSLPAGVTV